MNPVSPGVAHFPLYDTLARLTACYIMKSETNGKIMHGPCLVIVSVKSLNNSAGLVFS